MQNAFALTPRLTEHARLRCTQMEVNTKRVKRIVLRPSMVIPGPPHYGENFVATADYDPEIAVAYVIQNGRPVVKTVLWNTHESYTRPETVSA